MPSDGEQNQRLGSGSGDGRSVDNQPHTDVRVKLVHRILFCSNSALPPLVAQRRYFSCMIPRPPH